MMQKFDFSHSPADCRVTRQVARVMINAINQSENSVYALTAVVQLASVHEMVLAYADLTLGPGTRNKVIEAINAINVANETALALDSSPDLADFQGSEALAALVRGKPPASGPA